jgi:pimeloyl-ACP methyl ester carboxylesterase
MDYDGGRVRYIDIGQGDPIIFLHGLGGRIEDNGPCFPCFEKHYRIIAMDALGTGFSDFPEREYDIDYLVDFTFDFADRTGLDRFYVVGGSQGGMQTLLCCKQAPERIIKAAVYSPSGVWPRNQFITWLLRSLPPAAAWPFLHVTSLFWNAFLHPNYWENRRQALEFVDSRPFPGFGMHVLGCAASQFERDFCEIYATIETEILILWGQEDFAMPVKMGRELVNILPHAKLVEVPKSGHNVSIEKPEFFAEQVMKFFKGGIGL